MCRLLGIVASEPTEFRLVLREAPRSMAALSREHPDGWGLAIYEESAGVGWRLHRGTLCAGDDENFHRLAVGSRGEVLVSHVRQRTVGKLCLENTHPFQCGRWVFAHNGTLKDLGFLRERTSEARLAELKGQTDSELLFAYILTLMDRAAVTDAEVGPATDAVVKEAVRGLREREGIGAYNFLLSEGTVSYAHRFGRTLFLLERSPDDQVLPRRESRAGVVFETPWSQRRRAIFVASERLTDEPWQEVAEGMLLRIDRRPLPTYRIVAAG